MNILRRIFHRHQWETVCEGTRKSNWCSYSSGLFTRSTETLVRVQKCSCCGKRRGLELSENEILNHNPDWLEFAIRNGVPEKTKVAPI